MKIQFGNIVKDKITGFKGIVIGHCSYITGCDQFLIQPKSKKSDTRPEALWMDEHRLEIVDASIITLNTDKANGPDKPAPIR